MEHHVTGGGKKKKKVDATTTEYGTFESTPPSCGSCNKWKLGKLKSATMLIQLKIPTVGFMLEANV